MTFGAPNPAWVEARWAEEVLRGSAASWALTVLLAIVTALAARRRVTGAGSSAACVHRSPG